MAENALRPASPQSAGRTSSDDQGDDSKALKGDSFECPECHELLTGLNHRQKHAYGHWGNGDFPKFPSYDTARERYAALMGYDEKGK